MDVEVGDEEYVLTLSRSEFFLFTDALEEHLLIRGSGFDVAGYDFAAARAFASDLAAMTRAARERQAGSVEGK